MMRCRKVQRLIEAYLGNELNALQHGRVAKHLSTCPRCTETLDTVRELQRVFRRQGEPTAPDQRFAERVVARAREQNLLTGQPPGRYLLAFWMTNYPGFRKAVATAAILVGLTAGLFFTGTFQAYLAGGSGSVQTTAVQQDTTEETYGVDYFTDRPQGSLPDALFSLVDANNQRGQ